jgi:hypothetical protein
MVRSRFRKRSFARKILDQSGEETLHLKLFLRHLCPQCSEKTVAEELRQLHHVRHVRAHPERHEIEVWVGFPAEGLLREIVGVLNCFCCEVAASQVH